MSKKYSLFLIFFFIPALFGNAAIAEVYKWTDENGRTVYGDKPDSDNVNKIKIKPAPKQDAASIETHKKQKKLLEVMQQERDEKIAAKKKEKEKRQEQQAKCLEVIKELKETKDAALLYEETDDPENPRYFSDEERQLEEEKYAQYIEKNC